MRHALLANAILLVGMAWSFAYATATVGHLNILSVTFTATLIGIGIDYGVYYCARYLQLRKELDTCEAALLETSRTAGPAITIGADHHRHLVFRRRLHHVCGRGRIGHHRRRRHPALRCRRIDCAAGRDLLGRSQQSGAAACPSRWPSTPGSSQC